MTDGVGFPKQEAQQLQPKEKLSAQISALGAAR
jgi:hypothetical protein